MFYGVKHLLAEGRGGGGFRGHGVSAVGFLQSTNGSKTGTRREGEMLPLPQKKSECTDES